MRTPTSAVRPRIRALEALVALEGAGGGGLVAPFAIVNVTEAPFHVDNTGTADAGPALQLAFNALAGTGQGAWLPAGTYKIVTPVALPSNLIVWGDPGATVKSALTGAGNYAPWAGNVVLGAAATVTAINTTGTKIVQSSANYTSGTILFITDVLQLRGNIYTVKSSAPAGGHFNLTLDRPVNWQFAVSDNIQPITTLIQNVRIYGNGMLFTGTSAGTVTAYVQFGAAFRCIIQDCRADNSGGSLGAPSVGFNFDIASLECQIVRCRVDGGGVTDIAFALQSCERCRIENCTSLNCLSEGYAFLDCYDCAVAHSDDVDSALGLLCGSNEAANTTGTTNCRAIECVFSGSTSGASFANGSSENAFIGCSFDWQANSCVSVGNGTGTCNGNILLECRMTGCAGGAGGAGLLINDASTELLAIGLTVTNAQQYAVAIQASSCRIVLQDLYVRNAGLAGIDWVLVNGASYLAVKGAHLVTTQTVAGGPFGMFYAQGGAHVMLDDVVCDQPLGTTLMASVRAQALANWRLRNVQTPTMIHSFGVLANGGVAVTIRLLQGNDFSGAAVPVDFDGTAQVNRGTVVANGVNAVAVPFTDIQPAGQETVKLTSTATSAVGAAYLFSQTGGVGFSIKSQAGDANTYDYEIS